MEAEARPVFHALEHCRPLRIDGDTLVVSLAQTETFVYDKGVLIREKNMARIEDALHRATGFTMRLRVEDGQPVAPEQPPVAPTPPYPEPPPPQPPVEATANSIPFDSDDFDDFDQPAPDEDMPLPPPLSKPSRPASPPPPGGADAYAPAISSQELQRLARQRETPAQQLERIKQENKPFAEALDLIVKAFDGQVISVNNRDLPRKGR